MPSQTRETVQAPRPADASNSETTFRYKYAWAFCALTVALDGLAAIVVISTIRHGRFVDAALFGLIFFGSFSLIGWFVTTEQADVVVSGIGVSRRLWGRTLREISWENVKKIRVWKMYHRGYRRQVRVFWVFPVHPSRFRFTPSGKMMFVEPTDMSGLIEHMNRHIAAHGIPVEVWGGTSWSDWSDAASWSTRNRIDLTA
jgi:hypothetical protein